MKKRFSLFLISLLTVGGAFAQTLPEGMVSLLPDGVKAVITGSRKATQEKNLVVAGNPTNGYKAFFAAIDAVHGEELWVTDGTPNGTHLVKDINSGTNGSDIYWLTRFNDKVVFSANDDENGIELWISDGTADGTHLVKNIHEYGSSSPRGFTQLNETQFIFGAKNFDSEDYGTTGHWWLWVSDGTEDATELIYQCDTRFPGQDNASWYSPYCRVGRRVFFKADNSAGTVGEELWVTDGTTAGTQFVKDINPEEIATGTASSAIDQMTNFYNEKLFFKAWTPPCGNEPWTSDGPAAGTYQIIDSDPTVGDNGIGRDGNATEVGGFPYNGKVYFRGFTPDTGHELACSNLEPEDFTIFDIWTDTPSNTSESFADVGVEFDGVYMFCAATGFDATKPTNHGGELHYTDGETVTMQSDLGPGTQSNWVKELTVVSGSLYWWNESGELPEYKQKLFRIDNKNQVPVRVTNLDANGDAIHTLRNLDGDLLFARDMGNNEDLLYAYHYRKEGFDPETETDNLEIEYRTRDEIANGIKSVPASSAQLTIYPNPATDKLYFKVEGKVAHVKIYDLTGRLVKVEAQPAGNSINVGSLQKGIYKVLISGAKGNYVSSLIIK
jgi:ELWxxDGT repeat protein